MMNSFQKTVKYLRLININSALNTIKECAPINIKQIQNEKFGFVSKAKVLSFRPQSIGYDTAIVYDHRKKPSESRIQKDPVMYIPIINPRSILPLVEDWRKDEIGLPSLKQEEKQAARLIVIRRKKMKKHQRKKLYKRMKFKWARIKQNRRILKEKIFQNSLLAMVKEANEFSAEAYVASKLEKANQTPLPTRWKGKRLPQFIIRQLMGIDKKINYHHTDVYKA